jgi:DNA invertase Pin-like site-specific DNA recombinase
MAFDSLSITTPPTLKETMMRALGYMRVSTEEQADSRLGLEAQQATIDAYAAAHGWDIDWYADEGMSGKTLERPALRHALAELDARRAGVLVVSKLDRLSRSVADFAGLLEQAQRRHWSVVAIDLGVDTSTSAGELVANVMASVARWERRVIGERTSAALRAAQARGVHVGRPAALSAKSQARLLELRAAGLSLAKIATHLNAERVPTAHGGAWHPTTVSRILARLGRDDTPGALVDATQSGLHPNGTGE